VLTAGTGYFVAQEFAYVAADRLALAREAETGVRRGRYSEAPSWARGSFAGTRWCADGGGILRFLHPL
ncbi:hypothetical protein, partial [Streptomyces sp. NPDC001919]